MGLVVKVKKFMSIRRIVVISSISIFIALLYAIVSRNSNNSEDGDFNNKNHKTSTTLEEEEDEKSYPRNLPKSISSFDLLVTKSEFETIYLPQLLSSLENDEKTKQFSRLSESSKLRRLFNTKLANPTSSKFLLFPPSHVLSSKTSSTDSSSTTPSLRNKRRGNNNNNFGEIPKHNNNKPKPKIACLIS
jgi:hypothetical protein